ncbi:hypothetical protein Ae201684P_016885 [Aphanomyces euteiches]|nr:hypothetical protein Ae201684P_016885 [Aphanomyces euteiches]
MKSFVILAVGAVATTNAMPNDAPSMMTQDDRVLMPADYAWPVCFKHHGCGLYGKRGERDRGISPIIPAADTKHKCCNKKNGMGSAWGTGPDDCSNCR